MTECNACGAPSPRTFYTVPRTPISSVTLVTSASEAAAWPIGEIELGVCDVCGFIQNSSFDQDAIDLTKPTEDSQAFSPVFLEFARDTVQWLDREFQLADAPILEVGCGRGEWLALACRTLRSTGVGLDPAYRPGRVPPEDMARVRFLASPFDENAVHLTGKLVACRHTLEHISRVFPFVELLVRSAEETAGSCVFVEVPDTERILTEGAFWDVYYEHCSYFTSSSLAALLERAGLGRLTVKLGFFDQYLLATGTPASGRRTRSADAERVVRLAETFARQASMERLRWQHFLEERDTRPVVLWGASSKAVGFLAAVDRPVAAAVDINPAKAGSFLPGSATPVVAPDALVSLDPGAIIVMNPVYESEIRASLAGFGLQPQIVGLGSSSNAEQRWGANERTTH